MTMRKRWSDMEFLQGLASSAYPPSDLDETTGSRSRGPRPLSRASAPASARQRQLQPGRRSRGISFSSGQDRRHAPTYEIDDLRRRAVGRAGIEGRCRCIFDGELNRLGGFDAGDLRRDGEGEIDARGDPAAGDDVAVADDAAGIGNGAEQ